MTNEEMDATAAEALLEFSQLKKRIACLKKCIQSLSEGLHALQAQLSSEPAAVQATENEGLFRFKWTETIIYRRNRKDVEVAFNPAEIVNALQDLREATKQLNRIQTSLREMGHGHMLKE